MDAIRRYVLSIISAAILCGILNDLTQKSFFHKQMRFVCGVFMLLTILQPAFSLSIQELSLDTSFRSEAEAAITNGRTMYDNSLAKVIQQEMEAYILKEANQAGADVSVRIKVPSPEPPIQAYAEINGVIGDQEKHRLEAALEQLGIPKGNQTWSTQESNDLNSLFPEN